MSKQTAVDFLKEKLTYIFINDEGFHKLFEQAKAMEFEQIIDAYDIGCNDGIKSMCDVYQVPSSVQYYNETYKGGEQ